MASALSPTAKLLRAALLIVLLAAQGLAVAHEFTHWNKPAKELCASCSLSSSLDTPIASATTVFQAPQATVFPYQKDRQGLHCTAPHPYFQRGPPVSL